MELVEVCNDFERLWFFSNVLSTPKTSQFRKLTSPLSDSDHGVINVHEKISSWLEDSVDAAIAAVEEEEREEELKKEEEASDAELAKLSETAEQSTLIAMLMSIPAASIKPTADSRNRMKKEARSKRKVMSVKNQLLFEKKRSVLKEIQSGYFPQSERWFNIPFGRTSAS